MLSVKNLFKRGNKENKQPGPNKVSKYKVNNSVDPAEQHAGGEASGSTAAPEDGQVHYHTYTYPSGDVYKGDWKNNKKHGRGRAEYVDGNRYEGEWKDDAKHGQGTITFSDGTSYTGEWVCDKKCGQGSALFSSGNRYVGEWAEDNMHGYGTFFYSTGEKYEGEWVKSRISGFGVWTAIDGETQYAGEWKNDLRHGKGKLNKDGTIFIVKYHNGSLQTAIPEEKAKHTANDDNQRNNHNEHYAAAEMGAAAGEIPTHNPARPVSANKKAMKRRERQQQQQQQLQGDEGRVDNHNSNHVSNSDISENENYKQYHSKADRPQSSRQKNRKQNRDNQHNTIIAAELQQPSSGSTRYQAANGYSTDDNTDHSDNQALYSNQRHQPIERPPAAQDRPGTAQGGSRPTTASKKSRKQRNTDPSLSDDVLAGIQTSNSKPPPPPEWLQRPGSRGVQRPGSAAATEGRNLRPMANRVVASPSNPDPKGMFGKALTAGQPLGREAVSLANDLDSYTSKPTKEEDDSMASSSPWSLRPFLDLGDRGTPAGNNSSLKSSSSNGASDEILSGTPPKHGQQHTPPATPPQRPGTSSGQRPGTASGRESPLPSKKKGTTSNFLPPLADDPTTGNSVANDTLPPLNSNSPQTQGEEVATAPAKKKRKKKKKRAEQQALLTQEDTQNQQEMV
eukprot:TRINITY_DN66819_c7_g1_i1.p1 TRINITY_DN66819_c7_g1~~TRINITY_DN66819_c7_g1_i1.p1  ORF type:complete len:676 (-),score=79.80 TRINITY_DN66819_c7_g1_i1:196-2223(-)